MLCLIMYKVRSENGYGFLKARSENGCGKWQFFDLQLGLDFEMRADTPTKNSKEYPPGGGGAFGSPQNVSGRISIASLGRLLAGCCVLFNQVCSGDMADDSLLSFKGIRFTVIFDGKVLLNQTLSGKTGTRLSSEGGVHGNIVENCCAIRRQF